MEPRHVETELLEHLAGRVHERERSTEIHIAALQVRNQLGQDLRTDPPSRTGPVAALANFAANELGAEARDITLHQLQFFGEDQIIWRACEMEELDVRVGRRVAKPTRHRHIGSNAAATGDEQEGTSVIGDASKSSVRPVEKERAADMYI